MRTSSTFSILFWVYGKRAINNKANIYLRITSNGQRVNIKLKKKIDVTTCDEKLQRSKGKGKESGILNLYWKNYEVCGCNAQIYFEKFRKIIHPN